jgi:hypothetical protein
MVKTRLRPSAWIIEFGIRAAVDNGASCRIAIYHVPTGIGNRAARLIVFDLNEYWPGLIKDIEPKITGSRFRNRLLRPQGG